MIRFTPSSADRVFACPASAVLPQKYEPAGPAAERGTRIHDEYASAVDARAPHVTALPFDWTAEAHVEVAYAYDVAEDSGRVLGYRVGRRYPPVGPSELKGSADLVLTAERSAEVIDWKTGYSRGYTWQPRIYALAAARAHRVSTVSTALVYLDSAGPEIVREKFSAFGLAALARDVRQIVRRVDESDGTDVHPGDHCKWCPAKHACPAHATALATLRTTSWVDRLDAELQTPTGIALWQRRLPMIAGALDTVKERIRSAVEQAGGSLSLGDGTALRLATSTRASISVDDVLSELPPEFAAELRDRLTVRTTYTTLRTTKEKRT